MEPRHAKGFIGTFIGVSLLLLGLARRSDELKRAAFLTLLFAVITAAPAFLTGEPAEEIVPAVPEVSKPLVERHEAVAQIALLSTAAIGALALGFLIFRAKQSIPQWMLYSILLGGFVVGDLMAWTANLGGQVRHEEIRAEASGRIADPSEPDRD